MSEYTPTAEEALAEIRANATSSDSAMTGDGFATALTRWLAQHDAEVAAKALRNAADKFGQQSSNTSEETMPSEDDMGYVTTSFWLRTWADRIEASA